MISASPFAFTSSFTPVALRSINCDAFALDDTSHSVYTGVISIDKRSPRSEAYQANRNLLLASGGDLVTVLVGAGVETAGAETAIGDILQQHVHDHHPGTELVIYPTGHRGDALLIGVE